MDFYEITERPGKGENDPSTLYPDFIVKRSKDLMTRAKEFYSIWDEEAGLWSTDEFDVQRIVDSEIDAYRDELKAAGKAVTSKHMRRSSSGIWKNFRQFMRDVPESFHQLDKGLTFANTKVKKSDYVSKRLPYSLEEGNYQAWDEIVGTLYDPEERAKIEWVIGAIVSGDSTSIEKFLYFYGTQGAGKSTIIKIIQWMFPGYYTTFNAKALTSQNNAFALEAFRTNPLIAIEHDGDLSRIDDNSKFNALVSHEEMEMNEKNKSSYTAQFQAFPIIASNKPLKITDAKSGVIRRAIDVEPSGRRFSPKDYNTLMEQVRFELGAIAFHCLSRYREMGKNYYSAYVPLNMMLKTDPFYNFIEDSYELFKEQGGTTLKQAYAVYKTWFAEQGMEHQMPQHRFREELSNYFQKFDERIVIDGVIVRSWYSDFNTERFKVTVKETAVLPLVMDQQTSIFDELMAEQPAQYATAQETPKKKWSEVGTTLADLDTNKLHYLQVPENHIVIDFDLKGSDGQKSAELNLEAASKWPSTYSEYSKGGGGIHLHYDYAGDISELSRVFAEGIEIKVFTGDSSLRRKLSYCNSVPVLTINSGLPLKEKKMISSETVKSEKALRELVHRNLRKEIHPGTKPSVDFIKHILDEAYEAGLPYDLSDMQTKLMVFANGSSNQPLVALKVVQQMKLQGKPEAIEKVNKDIDVKQDTLELDDKRNVFFDVEVSPNLLMICWKYQGSDQTVTMINPSAFEVEQLFKLRLIGFNNRKYDNHILYAASMGFTNEQIYKLSKKIIDKGQNAFFGAAYNLSYADVHDYLSKKQGLKKWQIEMGIMHKELGLNWDEPWPEERWAEVAEYCINDVISLEELFVAEEQDFVARQILADLSGLSVNDTTNSHSARIIFGDERNPQKDHIYTHLDEMFPGYKFEKGKSTYRGEDVGEGGYVHAEPGMYEDVALLDVASMHPSSIILLELFGKEFTDRFKAMVDARVAIKRKQYDKARKMLGGALAAYLTDESSAKKLSYALKIVINMVYGLTSAKFPNPFKDPRNVDNIVAKRGALFMIDLREAVREKGFIAAHIKTDSIKIPNATPEIIKFVFEFGAKYGYEFEHEATYEKFALVNDAVYIAKYGWAADEEKIGTWDATGAQFQHPYVFKTLFSKEPLVFADYCETKSVNTALYLDFRVNEDTPMVMEDKELHFVGKVGSFTPVTRGGAHLYREKEGRLYFATGATGYDWLESITVKELHLEEDIDMGYFNKLVDKAIANLSQYGDVEWLMAA